MKDGFFSNPQNRVLASLALLMAILALASYATVNFEKMKFLNPIPATISVSGEGEVFAVPDVGQFSFSVMADGADAKIAQEKSGVKINGIVAYLKEQGIEEKDIKTLGYNLSPKWRYEEKPCPFGSYCPGEQIQDGFEVSQTITVKVRDTSKSGAIIAGVGEREATNISSLEFTVDDVEAVKEKARKEAIEDAQAKADVLAEQLGVKVIRLASYNEEGGYYPPTVDFRTATLESKDAAFGGSVMPVGENSIKVRVNVIYEVK